MGTADPSSSLGKAVEAITLVKQKSAISCDITQLNHGETPYPIITGAALPMRKYTQYIPHPTGLNMEISMKPKQ